jgi:hypothetical protein
MNAAPRQVPGSGLEACENLSMPSSPKARWLPTINVAAYGRVSIPGVAFFALPKRLSASST